MAFFADRKFSAPAPQLINEIASVGRPIQVYSELSQCLRRLRQEVPDLDTGLVAAALLEHLHSEVERGASRNGFDIGSLADHEISSFVTEKHDVLAVSFRLYVEAVDVQGSGRSDVTIEIVGEGLYSVSSGSIADSRLREIVYNWTEQDGRRRSATGAYIHAGTGYIGPGPDVEYIVRSPLA